VNLQELELRGNSLHYSMVRTLIANYRRQHPECRIYIESHPVIIPGIFTLAIVFLAYLFAIHFLPIPPSRFLSPDE
jgi:hypothetical protein